MATVPFSLRIDAKLKAKLEKEAAREDRSSAYMAQRAIAEFVDARDAKRKALEEAFAEADRGTFVSGEAVEKWMASWGTGHELPMPEPDIFPDKTSK